MTASVPSRIAKLLCETFPAGESGYPQPGFARSEQRLVIGGKAWRRWEPRQGSKAWGLEYESWEFSGGTAAGPAELLAGRECRPSRVDIAWDFDCDQHDTPSDLLEPLRAHVEARGLKTWTSGPDDNRTRYVGSPESERRICIYRKDLQPTLWGSLMGPTLRVELRLRRDQAAAWWSVWTQDRERAFAAAAGHILEMTGATTQRGIEAIPELVAPEGMDAAQQIFAFLDQNAATLTALEAAGIDLRDLARERAAKSSRSTHWRIKQRIVELRAIGADQLVALVRARIAAI